MRLAKNFRLQLHLLYALAAALLLVLWAGVAGWLVMARADAIEAALGRAVAQVETLAARAGELFGTVDVALKAATVAYRSELSRDPLGLHQSLRETAALVPSIRDLALLDAAGMVRYSSLNLMPPPLDGSKLPGFLLHRDGAESFLDEPAPTRDSDAWVLIQSRRVASGDGTFAGMTMATLDLDQVAKELDLASVARGAQIALVRRANIVVSYPAADEVGRPLRGRRLVEMTQMPVGVAGALAETVPGAPTRIANDQAIGATTQLPRHPLAIAAIMQPKNVLADYRRTRVILLVLAGIATLAILAGTIVLRRAVRRQAREAASMRLYNERYELGVLATDDGVWDWDLRTGRLYISSAYARLLGTDRRAGTIDAEAMSDLVHPEDRERVAEAMDAYLAGLTGQLSEVYRARHSSGRWLWLEVKATAERDELGRAVRLVGTARDITERPLVVSL